MANGVVRDNRPAGKNNGAGGGVAVLAAGGLGLLGFGVYEALKPKNPSSSSGTPISVGPTSCGPFTGPAANLATGLYVSWFNDPNCPACNNQIGSYWWVVKGVGRWGIPSLAQLTRCGLTYADAKTADFGDADSPDNQYIGTIGYVSACTPLPPGVPAAV